MNSCSFSQLHQKKLTYCHVPLLPMMLRAYNLDPYCTTVHCTIVKSACITKTPRNLLIHDKQKQRSHSIKKLKGHKVSNSEKLYHAILCHSRNQTLWYLKRLQLILTFSVNVKDIISFAANFASSSSFFTKTLSILARRDYHVSKDYPRT